MKPKTDIKEDLFRNLENYQSIDIEADWQRVRERMGFEKSRRLNPYSRRPMWQRYGNWNWTTVKRSQ